MTSRNFEDAREAIASSTPESSVYIGCDSQRHRNKDGSYYAIYSAVIVLHMDSSRGGRIFYEKRKERDFGKKTESLRLRLLKETQYAIEALESIIDVIGDRHLEIHLDINSKEQYASNTAVSEALGYVKGVTGYDALIKPQAWAATHAADHAVRNFS